MALGSVASRVSMKQPRQVRLGCRRHSSVRVDTVLGSIIVVDRGSVMGSGREVFWVSLVGLQEDTGGVESDVVVGVLWRWGAIAGTSWDGGQGATARPREGSVPRGRGRVGDVGAVLCVVQALCDVSAAAGGEDGGRAASTGPHRLRSPLCSHTPGKITRKGFNSSKSKYV